jgi:hypothetical protein
MLMRILAAYLLLVSSACAVLEKGDVNPADSTCAQLYRLSSLEPSIAPISGATPAERAAADRHNAELEVSMISLAAERACSALGRYPESLAELIRFGQQLPPSASCVLRWPVAPDPWGHPYVYRRVGGEMQVMSHGPDRQLNTSDDVVLRPPRSEIVRIDVQELCVD